MLGICRTTIIHAIQISAHSNVQLADSRYHTISGIIIAVNTHDMPTVAVMSNRNNHTEIMILIIHHGNKQINIPTAVATPFPPRNPKNGVKQLPNNNAHTMPIMYTAVIPHR